MSVELREEVIARLREVLGARRVDTQPTAREAYARDLSTLGHLAFAGSGPPPAPPPQAVVRPASVAEVQAVCRVCHELEVPVIPWGAGSGVCGGTFAVRGGVALDLKGLDRLREVDGTSLLATVEAGMNLQVFEETLNRRGLTLGHHPSSITCCTVGGAAAARGAGQLSTYYGKVEDMTVSLEVVLADGTLVTTAPLAPRAATGPDWTQLFVGSEGTLGVITACTFRLHRLPAERRFRSYSFPTLRQALNAIRETLQRGVRPAAVRLYDPLDTLMVANASDGPPLPDAPDAQPEDQPLGGSWPLSRVSLKRLGASLKALLPEAKEWGKRAALARPELVNKLTHELPGVGCLLLLSFEGEPELAEAGAEIADRVCRAEGGQDKGAAPAERWWRNRLAVSFKQSGVYQMGGFVDTMEVATTWSRLLTLHERVREAIGKHALVMAHFSHAYADGCSIYFTFAALRDDPESTLERYRAAWRDGLAAVVACGAAVSHHHGVGVLKADALKAAQGDLHSEVFIPVKRALDPQNVLNPGKLGLP